MDTPRPGRLAYATMRANRVKRDVFRPCAFSMSAVPMTIPVAMANGHAHCVTG